MKQIFRIACFITIAASLLFACKKAELVSYEQPDMVYFFKEMYSSSRDSVSYSFAIQDPALEFDTIFIPARIMGVAKDYDREIQLSAVDSLTTAIAGEDYEFVKAIIPAGAFSADIPVKINRGPGLKTEEKRLVIEIQKNKDFLPGVAESKASSNSYPGAATRYLIKVNDFLSKPDNWETNLKYYFGTYSQVKYAFIIQATGRAEFPSGPDGLPFSQFGYYQQVCRNALADYEAVHGPLIDEFENRVTF